MTSDLSKDVIIDVYEKPSKRNKDSLPTVLPSMLDEFGISYEYMDLVQLGGDYVLPKQEKVIERKTIQDLVGSFTRGGRKGKRRLDIQLQLCKDTYPNAKITLLIEDFYMAQFDYVTGCVWVPFKTDRWKSEKKWGTMTFQKQSSESTEMQFPKKIYTATGTLIGDISTEPLRQFQIGKSVRIYPNALFGKLVSLERKIEGLEIVKCTNGVHASKWIIEQLQGSTKQGSHRMTPMRQKRAFSSIPEQQRFVIEGNPGISATMGDRILKKYITLKNAFDHVDEWKDAISRIPKKTVDSVKELWETPYEYEEDSNNE